MEINRIEVISAVVSEMIADTARGKTAEGIHTSFRHGTDGRAYRNCAEVLTRACADKRTAPRLP